MQVNQKNDNKKSLPTHVKISGGLIGFLTIFLIIFYWIAFMPVIEPINPAKEAALSLLGVREVSEIAILDQQVDRISIYEEDSSDSPIITTLTGGSFRVEEKRGDWILVGWSEMNGWVRRDQVDILN